MLSSLSFLSTKQKIWLLKKRQERKLRAKRLIWKGNCQLHCWIWKTKNRSYQGLKSRIMLHNLRYLNSIKCLIESLMLFLSIIPFFLIYLLRSVVQCFWISLLRTVIYRIYPCNIRMLKSIIEYPPCKYGITKQKALSFSCLGFIASSKLRLSVDLTAVHDTNSSSDWNGIF